MDVFIWIATLGGIGYLPLSGFIAMILGILWMYYLSQKTQYWSWILVAQILLGIIFISLTPSQGAFDPSVFVLDEFVAAGILMFASKKLFPLLLGLTVYGILDLTKPLARYIENLPVGFGIVGDDIVSAILATLFIILIKHLILHYKTSIKTDK
ncbi:MAG: phosphatidylglycerophosphatase A [Candidatus Nanoarchaeia archaeon]